MMSIVANAVTLTPTPTAIATLLLRGLDSGCELVAGEGAKDDVWGGRDVEATLEVLVVIVAKGLVSRLNVASGMTLCVDVETDAQ